ncbi:hypothetical protein ACWD63_13880, partial [Streptomyces clavifer]
HRPAGAARARLDAGAAGLPAAELPSRRRRTRRAPAAPAASREEAEELVARTPEQAGNSWAALQEGTLSGRKAPGGDAPGGGVPTPPAASSDDQGDET